MDERYSTDNREVIERTFLIAKKAWQCANPFCHRAHQSRETAERCNTPNPHNPSPHRWSVGDFRTVVHLHDQCGMSFVEIGKEYGVTRERARQVYRKAQRVLRRLAASNDKTASAATKAILRLIAAKKANDTAQ